MITSAAEIRGVSLILLFAFFLGVTGCSNSGEGEINEVLADAIFKDFVLASSEVEVLHPEYLDIKKTVGDSPADKKAFALLETVLLSDAFEILACEVQLRMLSSEGVDVEHRIAEITTCKNKHSALFRKALNSQIDQSGLAKALLHYYQPSFERTRQNLQVEFPPEIYSKITIISGAKQTTNNQ